MKRRRQLVAVAPILVVLALLGGCGRASVTSKPQVTMLFAQPGLTLIGSTDRAGVPVLYSLADPAHWRNITPPTARRLDRNGGYGRFIGASFFGADTGWVVACDLGNYEMTVYETNDGGRTWRDGPGSGDHCNESVQAITAHLAISDAAGEGVGSVILAESVDDGATWQDLFTESDGGQPFGPYRTPVMFADALEGFSTSLIGPIAADDGWPAGFFVVTRDGGRTWTQQAPPATGGPPAQYALPVFSDSDHGVLATLGGKMPNLTLGFDTTTDGGRTWQPRTSLATTEQSVLKWPIVQRDVSVAVASSTTWWAVSPTQPPTVQVTTDAGMNWTSFAASGLPAAPDELYALDATHAWARVTTSIGGSPSDALNGNDYTVQAYFTSDGGRRWSLVSLP